MSDTDPDLDRLQDVLNAIPAERDSMTIAELDGYVAALIVCPDMILPSEWLQGVWGGEHEFADVAEAEATIAAVMEHYNRIAGELAEHPEDYVAGPGNRPRTAAKPCGNRGSTASNRPCGCARMRGRRSR